MKIYRYSIQLSTTEHYYQDDLAKRIENLFMLVLKMAVSVHAVEMESKDVNKGLD